MFNLKRGQGNVIAWVLLVGFAVSLAVLVGRWSIQQSQTSVSGIVSTGESDIMCENVAISAVYTGSGGNYNLDISNKGSLNIYQLNVGGCTTTEIKDFSDGKLGLNENEIKSVSGCNNDVITLIPLIKIDEELTGCATRELNIDISNCAIG